MSLHHSSAEGTYIQSSGRNCTNSPGCWILIFKIRALSPDQIIKAKALMTIVGGQIVYDGR